MNILMHMPAGVFKQCFHPRDLNRLEMQHKIIRPTDTMDFAQFWADHAASCEVVVTGWGTPAITNEMLDAAPNLRMLSHSAGTFKHLLPPSFWLRDIRLTSCNEALAIPVAEATVALMVFGLKAFIFCRALTRKGGWDYSKYAGHFPVRELYGTKVGIIGASKVGREVIRLLHSYDVEILVADPHLSLTETDKLRVKKVSLDEVLSTCEIVSCHAPSLPETRHMLSAPQFKLMKDGTIFINTSRGALVNEADLVNELKTGRIFAFIDVTDPEPPAADHPFRSLPNCILLPHVTGPVTNGRFRQGRQVVDQIFALAANTPIRGEVTREQAKIMA